MRGSKLSKKLTNNRAKGKWFKASRLLVVLFAGLILLTGCSISQDTKERTTITVAAAASLADALNEMAGDFQAANPDIDVRFTFGASGTLQRQIEQGAPIDIFISAGAQQMDTLVTKGLIGRDTVKPLARNEVVLAVRAENGVVLDSFEDLTRGDITKIAMGNPKTVPAGQYGKQVLDYYQIYEKVQLKLVFAEDVRQALAMLTTGNADAGIVYKTDALGNKNVKIAVVAPQGSHQDVVYSVGLVNESNNSAAARKWIDYTISPNSLKTLEKYGFTKP